MNSTIEYKIKDKTAELEEVTLRDGVLVVKFKDKKPKAPKYPTTLPVDILISGWYGPKGYRLQTHESREVTCCCCGAPIEAGTQHARWTLPGKPSNFLPGKPQDDPWARAAHPGCLWLAFPGGRPMYRTPEGFKAPEGLVYHNPELTAEEEIQPPVPDLQPVHIHGEGMEFLLFFKTIRKDRSLHAKVGAYKHTHCSDMPWREFTRGTDRAVQAQRLVSAKLKSDAISPARRQILSAILEAL